MKRRGAEKTTSNLLAAASEIFADKGYREATVADICGRAGTNIAAVNYHFGDKETLYREAWRHAFRESLRLHPPDGGVDNDASPEERLRGQVSALLHRIADRRNKEFIITHREIANPTGLLEEVMQASLRPLQERMTALVRELLAPRALNTQVRLCTMSIVSQCINPMIMRGMTMEKQKNKNGTAEIDDIDAYADHVVRFSLAGIRAIRREAVKRESGLQKRRTGGNSLIQK
jgi:AcrR family transcriptional regulator